MKIPYLEDIQVSLGKFIMIAGLVANSISWYYLMTKFLESLLTHAQFSLSFLGRDTILASFDDGAVALSERSVGNGRVLVWASTLDAYWNNIPQQPVLSSDGL